MAPFRSFLKRHVEVAILVFGCLSMLIFSIPSGSLFFPPFPVVASYVLLAVISFIRRPEDRSLSIAAATALSIVGIYWYWRAYAHWNSLGIILDYEMPIATLAISISATVVLLARKMKHKSAQR